MHTNTHTYTHTHTHVNTQTYTHTHTHTHTHAHTNQHIHTHTHTDLLSKVMFMFRSTHESKGTFSCFEMNYRAMSEYIINCPLVSLQLSKSVLSRHCNTSGSAVFIWKWKPPTMYLCLNPSMYICVGGSVLL